MMIAAPATGSGPLLDPHMIRLPGKGERVENLSRDLIHQRLSVGTVVVAENGERLGRIHAIHPHYVIVGEEGNEQRDLEVPVRALSNYDGETLHITVNREALTEVTHEAAAEGQEQGG